VPVDRFAMSLRGDRRWPGDSAEVGCGHVSSHLPGKGKADVLVSDDQLLLLSRTRPMTVTLQ
jgi:hypothetical protein